MAARVDDDAGGGGTTCAHLHASESNLKRYATGLKWGKKIKRGEVRRDDDEDDDDRYGSSHSEAKRRKVGTAGLLSELGAHTQGTHSCCPILPAHSASLPCIGRLCA